MKNANDYAIWLAHNHDNIKIDPRIRHSETLMRGYYEASRINLDYKNIKRVKELSAEEFNKLKSLERKEANKRAFMAVLIDVSVTLLPLIVVLSLYAADKFRDLQTFGAWALFTAIGWPLIAVLCKVLILPWLRNKKGGSL